MKLDWVTLFGRRAAKFHSATPPPPPAYTVSNAASNTSVNPNNQGFHAWVDWMTAKGFFERDSSNRLWIKHWDVAAPRIFGLAGLNQPLDTRATLAMGLAMTDPNNHDVWTGNTAGWLGEIIKKIPVVSQFMKGAQEFVDDKGIKYHLYRNEVMSKWAWDDASGQATFTSWAKEAFG